MSKLCDECETVAHCLKHGCIPKQALAAQQEHEPENEPFVSLASVQEPVQEPVGLIERLKNPEDHYEFTDPKKANAVLMSLCQEAADALAAPVPQKPWVDLTVEQKARIHNECADSISLAIELTLAEVRKTAAQPAVPDALTSADIQEHIEYVAGWNECRQTMLEMMK
jgi:hypothetical protein